MCVIRKIVGVIPDILVGIQLLRLQLRDRGLIDLGLFIQGISIEHPNHVILIPSRRLMISRLHIPMPLSWASWSIHVLRFIVNDPSVWTYATWRILYLHVKQFVPISSSLAFQSEPHRMCLWISWRRGKKGWKRSKPNSCIVEDVYTFFDSMWPM